MRSLFDPVETQETRFWYLVFGGDHLRRSYRAPKDHRQHVVEVRSFVSGTTYRHVLIPSGHASIVTMTTTCQDDRETLIPFRVAELLGCEDAVSTVEVAGRCVPKYRDFGP